MKESFQKHVLKYLVDSVINECILLQWESSIYSSISKCIKKDLVGLSSLLKTLLAVVTIILYCFNQTVLL